MAPFWGGTSVLFFPIGLHYLLVYRRANERVQPPNRRDRLAQMFAATSGIAIIVATVLAPPVPYRQTIYWVVAFAATLPVAYALLYRHEHTRVGQRP